MKNLSAHCVPSFWSSRNLSFVLDLELLQNCLKKFLHIFLILIFLFLNLNQHPESRFKTLLCPHNNEMFFLKCLIVC